MSFKDWRYKDFKGYIFDRIIFNLAFFSIFFFIFFIIYSNNFELNYFKCGAPLSETCKNPFYKELTWENYERLAPGEYGFNPKKFNYVSYICFLALIISFIINHFINNRNFKLFQKLGKLLEGENGNNNNGTN